MLSKPDNPYEFQGTTRERVGRCVAYRSAHLESVIDDDGEMKSGIVIVAAAIAVLLVACGRTSDVTESTAQATTSTTFEATTVAPARTLGVTPEEFVASWNSLLRVNPFLIIDDFDVEEGTQLMQWFSDVWGLELTVDPASGELTEAKLRGSLDVHTDQAIMLAATWVSLVEALNGSMERDAEDFDRVMEQLGLPSSENESPEGFGSGSYTSEVVINGVRYNFEESGDDTVLTARPAP
jgi:hypothetical protein